MKFEDVENARKTFNDKKISARKKALPICIGVDLILVTLIVFFNYDALLNIFSNFSHSLFPLIMALPIIFFLIIFTVVIYVIIVNISTAKELEQYKKAYKGYFVSQQMTNTFSDIKYNHDAGLDKQELERTGMIDTGDRYRSNDLTIGSYKDVNFSQADVYVEEEHTDSDGDKHYVTIFKGRFMIFEFPKKFNSRLMLSHDCEPKIKTNPVTGKALSRIETESVEFNKCYLTYAEDGMEAFYILTPDFMERAQELGRSHNNKVSIYFSDNKMVVGINDGNDIFEPPNPKNPLDEKTEMSKVNKEMNLITHIIDNLKLERKISK